MWVDGAFSTLGSKVTARKNQGSLSREWGEWIPIITMYGFIASFPKSLGHHLWRHRLQWPKILERKSLGHSSWHQHISMYLGEVQHIKHIKLWKSGCIFWEDVADLYTVYIYIYQSWIDEFWMVNGEDMFRFFIYETLSNGISIENIGRWTMVNKEVPSDSPFTDLQDPSSCRRGTW